MNEMTVTDSQKVIEIISSQDVSVPDDEHTYHASDLIVHASLTKPASHREGLVVNGKKYHVMMIAVVTELPDEMVEKKINEMEDAQD